MSLNLRRFYFDEPRPGDGIENKRNPAPRDWFIERWSAYLQGWMPIDGVTYPDYDTAEFARRGLITDYPKHQFRLNAKERS